MPKFVGETVRYPLYLLPARFRRRGDIVVSLSIALVLGRLYEARITCALSQASFRTESYLEAKMVPARPSLLGIPWEIRRKIFTLLFTNGDDIQIEPSVDAPNLITPHLHDLDGNCSLSSQILRTCHQALDEGLLILYSNNTFHFGNTPYWETEFHTVERLIGAVNFGNIRRVKVGVRRICESDLIWPNGHPLFKSLKQLTLSSWHMEDWTTKSRRKAVKSLRVYHPEVEELVAAHPEVSFRLLCLVGRNRAVSCIISIAMVGPLTVH